MAGDHCPTCGAVVHVVSSGDGTAYYQPVAPIVYAVYVEDRMDGLYLFAAESDAEDFLRVVQDEGGDGYLRNEPVNVTAADLIAAEHAG